MIAVQEDIDWLIYAAFGLAGGVCATRWSDGVELAQQDRPFAATLEQPPAHLGAADRDLWLARWRAIRESPNLALVEQPTHKRRWLGARGVFASKVATYIERAQDACLVVVASEAERLLKGRTNPVSRRTLRQALLRSPAIVAAMDFVAPSAGPEDVLEKALRADAIPFLAAFLFTPSGIEKRRAWEQVWELQRREDRSENVEISPPPKFDPKDYVDFTLWSLRGKLDVPKERFISYPGCESDEDHEPVYGWAGWDHLQRAVALAGLYQDRKQREGWTKDRLLPMVAGLLALLPWLKQWHNDPSADLGGERPSDQFEAFISAECSEHGWTHDDLRACPPPVVGRGSRSKTRSARKPEPDDSLETDTQG